jgi:hypothetical protein
MSTPEQAAAVAADMGGAQQPSEEEMRAAYEAELSRITTSDMVLQSAASLLNIGGLRLGLVQDAKVERDLEQVRDAIDAVRALLPIVERRGGVGTQDMRPLRDALSQLQLAYTREVQTAASGDVAAAGPAPGDTAGGGTTSADEAAGTGGQGGGQPAPTNPEHSQSKDSSGPGPAESSGRLWVPGR